MEVVDFNTFILDQKKVAEAEQGVLIFYFVLKIFANKLAPYLCF